MLVSRNEYCFAARRLLRRNASVRYDRSNSLFGRARTDSTEAPISWTITPIKRLTMSELKTIRDWHGMDTITVNEGVCRSCPAPLFYQRGNGAGTER